MYRFSSRGLGLPLAALFLASASHNALAQSASTASLETVVVTASPLATDANSIATSVGTVDRDQILQSGGANLADALANMPGVSNTGFASGAERPVIRGFDASRVRILENGVGSFDVSDIGPDHGVPIDPLSTTKIEVVRGAATLRYGSQAIGGVVNAINNRVPLELPDKPISGEIEGSYGTGNDASAGSMLLDGKAGQFAFHADGFNRKTGDYAIPGGTQANSYFKGDGLSVGSSYFFGDSRIGAAIVHYDANYGVPSDTTHILMQQTKAMFGSSFAIEAGPLKTLTVDAGYGDYKHDEAEPSGAIDDTFKDKEWDSRAEALFGEMGPLSSAALGVQIQHRDFSALGAGADYLSPTSTSSRAGFFFGETPLADTLKFQFGGRVEQIDTRGTPASATPVSRSFTPLSGSVGLVYDPTETLTFGLTATSAARAPAVTELFAHGPHDGPNTFETGDPTLTLERANSLEANARLHMTDLEIEASLWGASFDHFIYGALTGNTCDDSAFPITCAPGGPGDLKELFYRQAGAKFWGTEMKATQALWQSDTGTLSGDAYADYVRATLASGGNVPRIPPYHVGVGLTWNSARFDADLRTTYTGTQHETGPTETATPGFWSLDMGLTWKPQNAEGLAVSLIGKNLTDSDEHNAVSLNKDVVTLPGRDIRVVLRYAF